MPTHVPRDADELLPHYSQTYEDKGTVLAFEPERRLSYTHWSPMGGSDDRP